MADIFPGLVVIVGMLGLLATGTWIFLALMLTAFIALAGVQGFPIDRVGSIAAKVIYRSATSFELAAVPMFIWMGEIMFRTDIAARLFRGLAPWLHYVPGRLYHTNTLGSVLFGAVCGSSAATTATVGRITHAELKKRGYQDGLALGSLAGAGTLGLLIPPSIILVIYGVLAEVSIAKLFAAGVIPGLMIAGMYSAYIGFACLARPTLLPAHEPAPVLRQFLRSAVELLPLASLIFSVLGSIYTGIATPSEAAAIGVVATLAYCAVTRQLSLRMLRESLRSGVLTSTMVCALLFASAFLSTAFGYMHIPRDLAAYVASLGLAPYTLIVVLFVFFLILGGPLDGVSIVVMTLPLTTPLMLNAGFDLIWYGIFLTIMAELAVISPPVGFNLNILQGISGHSMGFIARQSVPFFILMCFAIVLLTAFPQIALWLPNVLYAR
jgi:C4-dicarboxylate transporter DctM subunit